MKLVRIGRIVRAVGLRGLVGVGGSSGGLAELKRVALESEKGDPVWRNVLVARPQGRVWVLELEGVSRREEAEALVGKTVFALREDLSETAEGEYYWGDLENLLVVTVSGEEVGRVVGLYETGAVDVLVVKGRDREVLIPLAPYVTVDREAGRLLVDPPEGLLELERDEKGGPDRGG